MEGLSDDVLKERRAGRNINLAAKWREFDTWCLSREPSRTPPLVFVSLHFDQAHKCSRN